MVGPVMSKEEYHSSGILVPLEFVLPLHRNHCPPNNLNGVDVVFKFNAPDRHCGEA